MKRAIISVDQWVIQHAPNIWGLIQLTSVQISRLIDRAWKTFWLKVRGGLRVSCDQVLIKMWLMEGFNWVSWFWNQWKQKLMFSQRTGQMSRPWICVCTKLLYCNKTESHPKATGTYLIVTSWNVNIWRCASMYRSWRGSGAFHIDAYSAYINVILLVLVVKAALYCSTCLSYYHSHGFKAHQTHHSESTSSKLTTFELNTQQTNGGQCCCLMESKFLEKGCTNPKEVLQWIWAIVLSFCLFHNWIIVVVLCVIFNCFDMCNNIYTFCF